MNNLIRLKGIVVFFALVVIVGIALPKVVSAAQPESAGVQREAEQTWQEYRRLENEYDSIPDKQAAALEEIQIARYQHSQGLIDDQTFREKEANYVTVSQSLSARKAALETELPIQLDLAREAGARAREVGVIENALAAGQSNQDFSDDGSTGKAGVEVWLGLDSSECDTTRYTDDCDDQSRSGSVIAYANARRDAAEADAEAARQRAERLQALNNLNHGPTAEFPVEPSNGAVTGSNDPEAYGSDTAANVGQPAPDNTDQEATGSGVDGEDGIFDDEDGESFEALLDDLIANDPDNQDGNVVPDEGNGGLSEEELESLADQFNEQIDPNDMGFGPTYASPPTGGQFGGGDIFAGNVIDGVNANGGGFSGGPSGVGATQAERGGAVNSEHASSMAGIDAQGSNARVALNTAARDHETAERAAAQNRQQSAEVANAVTGAVTAGLAQGAAQLGGRVGAALGEQVIYEPHRDDGCGGGGCGGGANGGGSGGSSGTTTREREQTGGTAVATGGNTGGSGDACSRAKILVQETEQLKARLQNGDSSAQARYNAAAVESIQASNACVAIRDQQRAEEQQQTAQTQPTGGTTGGGSSTSGGSSSGQTAGSGSSGSGVTTNASKTALSGSSNSSAKASTCDSLKRQNDALVARKNKLGTIPSGGYVPVYTPAEAAQKRDLERQSTDVVQQAYNAGCWGPGGQP